MIPVYKPFLPKETYKYLNEVLDSGWISQGKYVQLVQERLAELLGVRFVLLTNNGTTATHLMARVGKELRMSFDYIAVPNNCYVAPWNVFADEEFALFPIDADLNTWNVDLETLDLVIKYNNIHNVLVVHNLGNVIDVPTLKEKYPEVTFFEDNCEGFLGKYPNGKMTGTAAMCSSISFYANKLITCGEGGAFITKNSDFYDLAKRMLGQGQSSKKFVHDIRGYNYRMTDIQAAILNGQLDLLPVVLENKDRVWNYYSAKLFTQFGFERVVRPQVAYGSPKWMYGVRVLGSEYDKAEVFFRENGVEIRPMFYPMSSHEHLQNQAFESAESNATLLNKECIILPSYPELTTQEQDKILEVLKRYCETIR